jgi:hypothetical protein
MDEDGNLIHFQLYLLAHSAFKNVYFRNGQIYEISLPKYKSFIKISFENQNTAEVDCWATFYFLNQKFNFAGLLLCSPYLRKIAHPGKNKNFLPFSVNLSFSVGAAIGSRAKSRV